MHSLDGPAIRTANRGHSRESIRTNRFAEKKNYFHNVPAIRANRLKTAIRNLSPPKRDSQKKGVQYLWPEGRNPRVGTLSGASGKTGPLRGL